MTAVDHLVRTVRGETTNALVLLAAAVPEIEAGTRASAWEMGAPWTLVSQALRNITGCPSLNVDDLRWRLLRAAVAQRGHLITANPHVDVTNLDVEIRCYAEALQRPEVDW